MAQSVVIIGAGITGIMAGYLIDKLHPETEITFFDAGPAPRFGTSEKSSEEHHGATLGKGRNARHFTGTEGLSFQNPIHTKLLFEPANADGPGWLAINEADLSPREQNWRGECIQRYRDHVKPENNPYDFMYTQLNYGGMAAWSLLVSLAPELGEFRISADDVYVTFSTEAELQADLTTESAFNPWQVESAVELADLTRLHPHPELAIATDRLSKQVLRVPGESWSIQSLWQHLYTGLGRTSEVKFKWSSPLHSLDSLPLADAYVWAAGSADVTPEIYSDHGRVQGVGGWWVTLPNPGFVTPFKFSAPQPSGYINFTPSPGGQEMYVSGGFGWVGERGYEEAKNLLQPAKEQLIRILSAYLRIPHEQMARYDFQCCIRPTTPTGLPDVKTHSISGKPHITLSGAGKAGATQASILALHVASELGLSDQLKSILSNYEVSEKTRSIQSGLSLLKNGFEPT